MPPQFLLRVCAFSSHSLGSFQSSHNLNTTLSHLECMPFGFLPLTLFKVIWNYNSRKLRLSSAWLHCQGLAPRECSPIGLTRRSTFVSHPTSDPLSQLILSFFSSKFLTFKKRILTNFSQSFHFSSLNREESKNTFIAPN